MSVYGVTFQKLKNRPGIKDAKGYVSESSSSEDICDVEDLASVMVRFDNGSALSIETSFSLNIKNNEGKIQLFGTKAGASLSPELEIFTEQNGYLTNVSLNTSTALSFEGLFENEIAHFVSCVQGKTACLAPMDDGVELMKILTAAYCSAETGHEVIL